MPIRSDWLVRKRSFLDNGITLEPYVGLSVPGRRIRAERVWQISIGGAISRGVDL